jgi:tRNA-Thr(GGU) m(6)t(6)A37 methyltransferase TsaA
MTLEPIGLLRTCFGEKFAVPRQPGLCPDAWGSLELFPKFRSLESVRGLEGFSHVWLIFGFHQTASKGWHPTVRPPRLGGNQRVGIFASRSTFRPNPIGLSLVQLEGIDLSAPNAPVLHFGGVDLVDLTPIYDIKPYLPYAEAVPDAVHGYAPPPEPTLEVEVAPEALAAFEALSPRAQRVITRCLALDPRPATQTRLASKSFGACLCGHHIRFAVQAHTCTITQIAPLPSGDSF